MKRLSKKEEDKRQLKKIEFARKEKEDLRRFLTEGILPEEWSGAENWQAILRATTKYLRLEEGRTCRIPIQLILVEDIIKDKSQLSQLLLILDTIRAILLDDQISLRKIIIQIEKDPNESKIRKLIEEFWQTEGRGGITFEWC